MSDWKRFILFCMVLCASICLGANLQIFENGKSNYQIVIPDGNSAMAKKCVEELNYHIKIATGTTLPVVKASGRDKSKPAIVLCTPPANAAEYGKPNGFAIQVSGKDIHIFGDDLDGGGFIWYWRDDAFDKKKGAFTRYGTLFGVYEFLEKAFGVRWLWPGKLGEYIPKTANAVWNDDVLTGQQKLMHSRIRYQPWRRSVKAWSGPKAKREFEQATYIWILRNRMVRAESMEYGHSYTDWYKKYSKIHPDIFNLLPNGKRVSDPYYCYGAPSVISMCISNPKIIDLKLQQWQAHRARLPFVNLAENDTGLKCICSACLALDVPNPTDQIDFANRVAIATKRFQAKDPKWYLSLGSLTDRYCVFYNKALAEAKKIDPDAKAVIYAYGNASKPPVKARVSKDIIAEYVPRIEYPWRKEQRETFRREWKAWCEAGASMFLRPNYTLRGHNFPIYYADEIAEDFSFAWKNGLVGTDFDSLTGQYATQGLQTYVCARIHMKGYLSKEEIFSEYFRAFGPAEKEVRAYYAYLKSLAAKTPDFNSKNFLGLNYAGFAGDFLSMPAVIFTDDVLDQCMALLDAAESKTVKDSLEYQRIQFLKNGIRHAKLNAAAQKAFMQYKKDGNLQPFARALEKLDAFRISIEPDMGCDFGFLYACESFAWNRDSIRAQSSGVPLNSNWFFSFDQNKVGEAQRFFAPEYKTKGWFPIQIGRNYNGQEPNLSWIKKHGTDYSGICWYKTKFTHKPARNAKKVEIVFGAVDEGCKVWFNGQLVLDRPYPYKGNTNSWNEPFAVDVTKLLKKNGENDLTVMVINNIGQGGIFQSVLIREK